MKIPKTNYKKEKRLKKRLEKEADKLWKIACFKKWGTRGETDGETYLATVHHYYYRRNFPYLRYSILNGVILSGTEHFLLHFKDPKMIEEKIIKVRGQQWLKQLQKERDSKPKFFKTDLRWYNKNIEELQNV